eukprot:Ihof_evm7s58 gene=Ihof_evmTU7s58
MTRVDMNTTNVPHTYWDYAIQAAVFTHSLMSTTTLPINQTSYSLRHHTPTLVCCLHTFGSKLYYRTDPATR